MSASRDRLAELLEPMLPDAWRRRIERYTVKSFGTLPGPSVFIDYIGMSHAGAPAGMFLDQFEIALISDLTDYAKAEDAIDEAAQHLVRQLDPSTEIVWSAATKRAFGDYLGWVVTVQLINNQE